ncbi:hypothetical protein L0U85_14625 [Glycomyces sp. L485]|uniref:hypothetical protein n=1 Tax=Glycomyces sp. L485 TaxID=2909235 RepID=UPI001F4B9C7B|nr:hypothetical protein [Glycomyces sp. L485]MCH7232080.1 hypothetical protein [Glycomyces sp. L485]
MTDAKPAESPGQKDVQTRSRPVKPGHLEIGEFTSGHIGATAPFGNTGFPLPVKDIHYEHDEPAPPRILEDERH